MSDDQKNPSERSVTPAEALMRARAIMEELPTRGFGSSTALFDARVVALMVLLEAARDHPAAPAYGVKGLAASTIRDELGIAQSIASEIVAVAAGLGLVAPVPHFDHRFSVYALTPKGWRLRLNRRGTR